MHKSTSSLAADIDSYQKLVRDQNVCIEQLQKSAQEDRMLIKNLQTQNNEMRTTVRQNSGNTVLIQKQSNIAGLAVRTGRGSP